MKLPEPFFAPGKMILFLCRGVAERSAHVGSLGHHGLPFVKGLGTHFPRMVNAHEPRRMAPGVIIEVRWGQLLGRRRAPRRHGARDGS
jgi:hypothetical protein